MTALYRPRTTAPPRVGRDFGRDLVERRHHEYLAHEVLWRRLLDSYEGGAAYRDGVYGYDRGYPIRNLVRHRREYPARSDVGDVLAAASTGAAPVDVYEIRRARTPVPRFVFTAVQKHISTIYSEGVSREGPPEYDAWAADADGAGRPLADWFRDEVAPFLLLLGVIDVGLDHPRLPPGEAAPESRADERRLGLDRVIAHTILPTNVLWWRAAPDRPGEYAEVLVREWHDTASGGVADYFRHWTARTVALYDPEGETVEAERDHGYGFVPIFRHLTWRRPGCRGVGLSPYEGVLEQEREHYNCDSEQILAATFQAHATLQGPRDQHKPDGSVAVGPQWTLAVGEASDGSPVPWSYLTPPPDPIESLRDSNRERVDLMLSMTGQAKPAGVGSGGSQTVAQSGISKKIDQESGNDLLVTLAGKLADCEAKAGRYAVAVARGGGVRPSDVGDVVVTYPSGFNLLSAAEMAEFVDQFIAAIGLAGACPEVEAEAFRVWVRKALPGKADREYQALDAAIVRAIEASRVRAEEAAEAFAAGEGDGRDAPGGAVPPGDDTEE
jgi:hypothetical protein